MSSAMLVILGSSMTQFVKIWEVIEESESFIGCKSEGDELFAADFVVFQVGICLSVKEGVFAEAVRDNSENHN
jgi:hypothetical protein